MATAPAGRPKSASRPLTCWKLALAGLAVGLAAGWYGWPRLTVATVTQPIRFSHSAHARQAVACAACHGQNAALPSIEVCASCHPEPTGGKSEDQREIDKLVSLYVKRGKEVPWLVLAREPDHVLFTHKGHEDLACATCHPDMSREDYPAYRRDRISGYSNWTMSMDRCRSCHRQKGASDECVACHK